MKKLIFFLAMLLPLGLLAQTDLIPLKRAKQVIVKTDVLAQEGYQLIIMALKENGYLLDQINETTFTAKTKERMAERGNIKYFITVNAKDNQVIISGQSKLNWELEHAYISPTAQYQDIEYGNSSYAKTVFRPLTKVAMSLNKPIAYNK